MKRLFHRPQAEADLAEILAYLAERTQTAAVRFLLHYRRATEILRHFPSSGSLETWDDQATLRRIVIPRFRNYLVFYRFDDDAVVIVRVAHVARDRDAIIRDIRDD